MVERTNGVLCRSKMMKVSRNDQKSYERPKMKSCFHGDQTTKTHIKNEQINTFYTEQCGYSIDTQTNAEYIDGTAVLTNCFRFIK